MSPYFTLFLLLLPFVSSVGLFGIELNDIISGVENIFNINIINGKHKDIDEDAYLNITELGKKYGYDIETHTVITEDKYVLNIHRIPSRVENAKVVFLMHGILDSADSWVLQGPKKALGYILADEDFDVWMGNARGNKYSKSHAILARSDSLFWNFTWEEIGLYDLPAMIDYISNMTKQSVYYIGHSQGTTSYFVLNSMTQYNKVKAMYALSPVAWMEHAKSPILRFLNNDLIRPFISMFDIPASSTEFFNTISTILCEFLPNTCDNALQMFAGIENRLINSTLLPVILRHFPSESSTLQLVHYYQLMNSGRFRRFDYGGGNVFKYGQLTPPDYNVSNIKTPISLFYSDNDWLSDMSDVATLYRRLPNVRGRCLVSDFNHLDYMYAKVAEYTVYGAIVKDIRKFEDENYSGSI